MTPELKKVFDDLFAFKHGLPSFLATPTPQRMLQSVLRVSALSDRLAALSRDIRLHTETAFVNMIMAAYAAEDTAGKLAMFYDCRRIWAKMVPDAQLIMSHETDAFARIVGEQFSGTARVEYLYELYQAVSSGKDET